jgi:hypothetical protein
VVQCAAVALAGWLGAHANVAHPLLGWSIAIVFAAGALTMAFVVLTGRATLRLDREGFEIKGLLKSTRLRWSQVASFGLGKNRGVAVIAVNYKPGEPSGSDVSRRLFGADVWIGDDYNVPLEEILKTLKEWQDRYERVT